MSSNASFYLLHTSKLDGLVDSADIIVKKTLFARKVSDNYLSYLTTNATELKSFNGSGYRYGSLFIYLQEKKGVDLLTNEYDALLKTISDKRGGTHFIFTAAQKDNYLHQLNPEKHWLTELQEFNLQFSDEGDEETALSTIEALEVLNDNLKKIQDPNHVMLLVVS